MSDSVKGLGEIEKDSGIVFFFFAIKRIMIYQRFDKVDE